MKEKAKHLLARRFAPRFSLVCERRLNRIKAFNLLIVSRARREAPSEQMFRSGPSGPRSIIFLSLVFNQFILLLHPRSERSERSERFIFSLGPFGPSLNHFLSFGLASLLLASLAKHYFLLFFWPRSLWELGQNFYWRLLRNRSARFARYADASLATLGHFGSFYFKTRMQKKNEMKERK